MTDRLDNSYIDWARTGRLSQYWDNISTPTRSLGIMTGVFPAGDVSSPVVPDLILSQDLGPSGMPVTADVGGKRFRNTSETGDFLLVAPNFASSIEVGSTARVRAISFDTRVWRDLMGDDVRQPSFEFGALYDGKFRSGLIGSMIDRLCRSCVEEDVMSLLLAQAAGCEILAELFRLGGSRINAAHGGLAPWAERRCVELMHSRLAEDISVVELAKEVRLSAFHFARMFKKSVGMSPRAYLVNLRVQKACDLLQNSDLSILEIAQEVGYSSSQVLARVFQKRMKLAPSEYRSATRFQPLRFERGAAGGDTAIGSLAGKVSFSASSSILSRRSFCPGPPASSCGVVSFRP